MNDQAIALLREMIDLIELGILTVTEDSPRGMPDNADAVESWLHRAGKMASPSDAESSPPPHS
jgi:hypothetical protein